MCYISMLTKTDPVTVQVASCQRYCEHPDHNTPNVMLTKPWSPPREQKHNLYESLTNMVCTQEFPSLFSSKSVHKGDSQESFIVVNPWWNSCTTKHFHFLTTSYLYTDIKQKNTPQKKTKPHHLQHTILVMLNFQRKKSCTPSNLPCPKHPTPNKKKEGHTTNPSHHVLQRGDGSRLQNELIHAHQGHGVTTRHILGGRFDKNSRSGVKPKKKKVSHGLQKKGIPEIWRHPTWQVQKK